MAFTQYLENALPCILIPYEKFMQNFSRETSREEATRKN